MSAETIDEFRPYRETILSAVRHTQHEQIDRAADQLSNVPTDVLLRAVSAQQRIHGQALAMVLMCCFTLEAYVNALAHFLLSEQDVLGLIRDGYQASLEVLFEAIERWAYATNGGAVGRLGKASGFDRSRSPRQDSETCFRSGVAYAFRARFRGFRSSKIDFASGTPCHIWDAAKRRVVRRPCDCADR